MTDRMDQSEVQACDSIYPPIQFTSYPLFHLRPSVFICGSIPLRVHSLVSFSQTSATALDGSSIRNSSGIESRSAGPTLR